jgi:hypothetical protein
MYWSLKEIGDELIVRVLYGPMHFRFILQPMMAITLGIRDGRQDARAGLPPFIWALLSDSTDRKGRLTRALWRLRVPVAIATGLDAVVQFVMFQHVRPLVAVALGSLLMGFPYSAARGLSNRFRSSRPTPGMKTGLHEGTAKVRP